VTDFRPLDMKQAGEWTSQYFNIPDQQLEVLEPYFPLRARLLTKFVEAALNDETYRTCWKSDSGAASKRLGEIFAEQRGELLAYLSSDARSKLNGLKTNLLCKRVCPAVLSPRSQRAQSCHSCVSARRSVLDFLASLYFGDKADGKYLDQKVVREFDMIHLGFCYLRHSDGRAFRLALAEPIHRDALEQAIRQSAPNMLAQFLARRISGTKDSSHRGKLLEELVYEALKTHEGKTVQQLVRAVAGGEQLPELPSWCETTTLPSLARFDLGNKADPEKQMQLLRDRPPGVYLYPTDSMRPDGLVFLDPQHAVIVGCKLLVASSRATQEEEHNEATLVIDDLFKQNRSPTNNRSETSDRREFKDLHAKKPTQGNLRLSVVLRGGTPLQKDVVEVVSKDDSCSDVLVRITLANWQRFLDDPNVYHDLTTLLDE